jgi:2'-5' RNA ligase
VIVVPEPAATEIDGLRRALGDPVLHRIMPHVTLVPPVNVRVDEVGAALSALRAAAAAARSMSFTLGPPRTFGPDSPTLYLPLGADPDDLERLDRLRSALFVAPLSRAVDHDFVPHVTVAAELPPTRLAAGIEALADYEGAFTARAVTLLRYEVSPTPLDPPSGRPRRVGPRWVPIADARLDPPAVIGRGGWEIELTIGSVVDPDGREVFEAAGLQVAPDPYPRPVRWAGAVPRAFVVTARHRGRAVGVGTGHVWPSFHAVRSGEVTSIVVRPDAADQGIERHLQLALESLLAGG